MEMLQKDVFVALLLKIVTNRKEKLPTSLLVMQVIVLKHNKAF